MWLPTLLYEILPYFYLLIGGVSVLQAVNPLMAIAGFVLIAAGATILRLRRLFRSAEGIS